MGSKDWRKFRKSRIINPHFQYRFMLYVCGIGAGTLTIFYAAKVLFFLKLRSYLASLGFPSDHLIYEFLTGQSRLMDLIFAAAAVVEVAFLGWTGLVLSHRVAALRVSIVEG